MLATKKPLLQREWGFQRANLIFRRTVFARTASASELAPASRRTGCCGVAGPGPQPLWIRLCFVVSFWVAENLQGRDESIGPEGGWFGPPDVGVRRHGA